MKYGVEVPKNMHHAYEIGEENENTLWRDATEKEITSLLSLGCFEFKSPDYKPSLDYQHTKLTMIYKVKQDGCCKVCLVVGGHLIDLRELIPGLQWSRELAYIY